MTSFTAPVQRRTARLVVAGLLALLTVPMGTVFPYFLTRGLQPMVYTVTADELVIRPGGMFTAEQRVPLDALASADTVVLRGSRKIAGTAAGRYCAGLFGYDGLGTVFVASDCSRQGVLLRRRDGSRAIVLTPDSARSFMQAVARRAPGVWRPAGGGMPSLFLRWLPWGLACLLLPVGAALPYLALQGPHRLRYLIADGILETRGAVLRRRYPIAGARVRRYRPRRQWRLAGTAMPGYYTGRFRLDGQSAQVWATTMVDGVLMEGAARVYVTPEDPTAFLAAMVAAGAVEATA
jgi:hypothetical protein